MKRIVDIQRQRGNRKRYTLYFDDGQWLGLFDELVIKYDLKVGKEVDSGEITELALEDDSKKAMDLAIRYLGYRARSQKEMENYLQGKGFCQDIIERTIDKLESYGYIDDRAFAGDWVRGRMKSKPMGKAMIKMELIQKGIAEEIIEESLEGIDEDTELLKAREVVLKFEKRYWDLGEGERNYKIGQALARRGFNWETIKRAIDLIDSEE